MAKRTRAKAASAGGLAVELIATAAAALGAPDPVWIAVAAIGLLMLVYAAVQWRGGEGEFEPATTASDDAQAVQDSSVEGDVSQIKAKNVSIEQTGGHTGDVYSITSPQPDLRPYWAFRNKPTQDPEPGYHSRLVIDVAAPYAFQSIYVYAESDVMKLMEVAPGQGQYGPRRTEPNPREPGVTYATIVDVCPQHLIEILTSEPDDEIDIEIQPNQTHPTILAGDETGGIAF